MILHGKDLIVSIDGNANMASKSCTLSVSAKSIVKTSPTSGDWEEVLSGKKSWSLTTNHLVKQATGGIPEDWDYITTFAVSNTLENGWHARGEQEAGVGDSYVFDEVGLANGIDVLRINSKTCQLLENRHFNGNASGLNDYLNGNTIGNDDMLLIMTNGEFVLPADVVATLSDTYHTALPFIEMGVASQWGNEYDTTPLIIACGKGITQGYAKLNSISNDLNFTLIDGTDFVLDGIPGAIDMVGKTVSVRMKDEHGSIWLGQAVVTQFKVTGTKGNLMAGSFSFKGNGELQSNKKIDMPEFFTPGIYVNRIIIDMSKSNSAEMITGDIGDAAKIFNDRMKYYNHRYLSKYLGNGRMVICQLDDENSNLFRNGTPATLDGTQGDVYMSTGGFAYELKQIDENRYMFSIADQPMNNNWKIWPNNNLIGAFKAQATTLYNNTEAGVAGGDYYLRSISKDATAFADTPVNLLGRFGTTQGKMNPAYFGLVGPEEHTIIALLYLMLKGNTNSRAMMGTGYSEILKTGITSNIGMRNTTGIEGNFVNIFGLENWWGGGPEVMERMMIDNNGLITITPKTGNPITIQGPLASGSGPVIKKMIFGDLYMAPSEVSYPYKDEYFCDKYLIRTGNGYVQRSKYEGGIFSLETMGGGGLTTSPSRICYRGDVTEYTDPQTFLALTAVDPAN